MFLPRVSDDLPISWAIFTASSAVCRDWLMVTDREQKGLKLLQLHSILYRSTWFLFYFFFSCSSPVKLFKRKNNLKIVYSV